MRTLASSGTFRTKTYQEPSFRLLNTVFCTWISSSSSKIIIVAFRRQIEYNVIFMFILHQNNSGGSGLPSPQLSDLIYTLISTTSSHPPYNSRVLSPEIYIQVGFRIGMLQDPVTDPICFFEFVFWFPVSPDYPFTSLLLENLTMIVVLSSWVPPLTRKTV